MQSREFQPEGKINQRAPAGVTPERSWGPTELNKDTRGREDMMRGLEDYALLWLKRGQFSPSVTRHMSLQSYTGCWVKNKTQTKKNKGDN